MPGARSTPKPGDYTFPATQGLLSGVAGLGLAALLIVIITFDGWGLSGLRMQIGLLGFAALTWALMLRPKIRLHDQRLLLVNPFDDISVPLHLIDSVQVRSVTKVHVGPRTYSGIAVGRRTRALVRPPTLGSMAGPFALARGGDSGAPPGTDTADLLEAWVTSAVDDARRDVGRRGLGTPDDADRRDDVVRRRPNLVLYATLGILAVALAVTLLL